jgi:hypothetical protein
VKNLDLLIHLIKNWPNNLRVNVEDNRPQGVDGFGEVEENLLNVLDMDFPNEVGGHVEEDDVQNWELYP